MPVAYLLIKQSHDPIICHEQEQEADKFKYKTLL